MAYFSPATFYSWFIGREQWIYAARIVRTGDIKIGHTVNIDKRIDLLRGQFKSDIELIGLTSGTIDMERCIHKQSAAHNVRYDECHKEVYAPAPAIMDFISREMQSPAEVFGDDYRVYTVYKGQAPLTEKAVEAICQRVFAVPQKKDKNRSICLFSRIRKQMCAGDDVMPLIQIMKRHYGDARSVYLLEEEAAAIIRARLNSPVETAVI